MTELENLVKDAVVGDRKALDTVITRIQDLVYNLALRMLWHPEEAKDATQEILIKIAGNLHKFEGKSTFKTWAYRVASNALLNYKAKHFKQKVSFDEFGEQLAMSHSDTITYTSDEVEQKLLVLEAKVGCSHAMLQCLDRESRLVYIIGEVLQFNSKEGSIILEITADNFRQKLSRARKSLHSFMQDHCGLIEKKNNCKCHKKVDSAIHMGHIQPSALLFANDKKNAELIDRIDQIEHEVGLFQSNPDYHAPEVLFEEVKRIVGAHIQ